jgi:UDP-N-acetylglucosamine 2-epimerase (non-hydrolysing)
MRRPRLVSVVGARPQFIKASPVSRQLRKKFEELLVHTGQHYDVDMSNVFFEELGIPTPDFTLGVGSKSHARQTGEMMEKLEEFLLAKKPDFVLVYGDTNSTLAGALTASKLNLPVGHVEAGLRSFDTRMPEEINRVIADRLSLILFAPTETAVRNLSNEGIADGVYLVGDVMADALKEHIDAASSRSKVLDDLRLEPGEYVVATVHRAGNTDITENLSKIVEILTRSPKKVVFPVHPRTRAALKTASLEEKLKESGDVLTTSPLGYLDMLFLQKNADAVVTDSGGMQKEAYLLGVRCITLREETEWIETVEDGWNRLVGIEVNRALDAIENFRPTSPRSDRFGKGDASARVASILEGYFETVVR